MKKVFEGFEEIFPREAPDIPRVIMAAPTGRAAKRIEEATGIQGAMTIHRMLRFTTPEDEQDMSLPRHDRFNPMPYDVILIDESSMLDAALWRALLAALKRGALLRFFGDINQLPPVVDDEGSPFAVALTKFSTARLTHNYRSSDGIIAVADRVIKGRIPIPNDKVRIHRIKSVDTMLVLRKLCDEHDFTKLDSQIITPTNTTKYGTVTINNFIQARYNPEKDKIQTFQKTKNGDVEVRAFKRGDKILWTKNNYDLEIMNGTIGLVQSFDKETGHIVITVDDGRDINIPPSIQGFNPTTGERFNYDPRVQMALGYAISTHKSQGSQFGVVLFVCTLSRAATRQNLYTGITRAKEELLILNVGGSMSDAVNTVAKLVK
jgi:exodeoxyribonuclease V alpha subunit